MKKLVMAVVGVGLLVSVSAFSKPEFAKKEGKACTYCHVKAGAKDLNDTGKCYKDNKFSLEKCKASDAK
ncbi:MAG: hypothetical protein HYY43_01505 [Deltaproteobacteria bacterium]|nr:hypothetical protein [Deltaproteobacteria bacterium]MBI2341230.1 hypothetical protein [Deltaproteobacteria bacterium]MBI2974253.1 hypothetical protein [Deltaproteobacteria bacterium]